VQRRGGGKPDQASELDVGAVRVALQDGQQPDVNIIKLNGHLTIDNCVVGRDWQM
jgi:hypothetical protein